jgi:hypothetical protein
MREVFVTVPAEYIREGHIVDPIGLFVHKVEDSPIADYVRVEIASRERVMATADVAKVGGNITYRVLVEGESK